MSNFNSDFSYLFPSHELVLTHFPFCTRNIDPHLVINDAEFSADLGRNASIRCSDSTCA